MPLKGNSSNKEENKGETRGEGQLEADSKLQLKAKEVVIGLSWDVTDHKSPVDLDASCCLFDNEGNFQSSVYFGVLTNENASVIHTGDNRSGEGDGDDECIVIKLDKVPASCRALVICINSYSGDTFANVNSATARILDASASKGRKQELELGRYELKAAGNHSGLLMCKIYRSSEDPSQWWLHTLGVAANGRSFADLLPLMQARLTDIIPDARIAKAPNVVVLAKGEMVALNSDRGLKTSRLTFGLGWDPIGSEAVDLDASCVIFDEKHSMREAVFFNQLKSSNGAVRHAGDNLTGAGQGDDEQIFVDLDSLPSDITTLYILVNSYSGHPFSRVKNCFVRVINGYARSKSDTNELVRYDLAGTGNPDHTALILCKVFSPDGARKGQRRWKLQALGYGSKGTMYKDNLTDLTKDLAGRLKLGENLAGFKYAPLQKAGTGSSSQPASTTDVLKLIIVILVLLLFWSIFNRGGSGGNSRIR